MNKQNYWIIPCNSKKFDVKSAFRDLRILDWRQTLTKNIKVGDIAFIYVSHLDKERFSKILFKCRINEINKTKSTIDDDRYSLESSFNNSYKRYMELELLEEYDDDYFNYNNLKNNGLKNFQSQSMASDELVDYLLNYENLDINMDIDMDIDFVNLEYLGSHEIKSGSKFRSKDTDYEKIYKLKKTVGNLGEKVILQNEINKLNKLGLSDLADKVSICNDDALGYDILSFDENGNEIHIEVKTNSSNTSYIDFYITDNELQHFINEDNYYIYYLYDIKGNPKCNIIDRRFILDNKNIIAKPVLYAVSIDFKEQ